MRGSGGVKVRVQCGLLPSCSVGSREEQPTLRVGEWAGKGKYSRNVEHIFSLHIFLIWQKFILFYFIE